MKIIKPSFKVIPHIEPAEVLMTLEEIGRTCYLSESNDKVSSADFIRKVLKRGHESVIEHMSFTVRIICDRGVSHELVRHRLASYSQESTRYCDYHKEGENDGCTFIQPYFKDFTNEKYECWYNAMYEADKAYRNLRRLGASPQEARGVLPNDLKTEIVMTQNLRSWRHFFKLRTEIYAHPKMRQITIPLLEECKRLYPVIFEDIEIDEYARIDI